MTVIVPAFNEPPEALNKTISSLTRQKHVELEIFIIDDGSLEPVQVQIMHPHIHTIRLSTNQGKRHAQMAGIERSTTDWIVTVDSDTELADDAVFNLYSELQHRKLDAITGTVFLANEKQNLLTRMTACMYWFSFFQERASQSYFGSLLCASGALSLYQKETILKNRETYMNQTFLGSECSAGDDRHLTSIFLLAGKKIGWTPKAKAWTNSPSTMHKFLKQQLRWTRSHVPGLCFLLRRVRWWTPILALHIFKFVFRYVYMFAIYLLVIALSIHLMNPLPIAVTLLSILVITLIKANVAYIYTLESKFAWLLVFTMYVFFVFNPLMFYAILTPTKTGWMTRARKS
jgi:hyaluronan synthase/N-acetylglucosaminyltransferase